MILFRHGDPRYPFLWEETSQPPGRWHGEGEGPVQYLADTPDGAWAEFLRHEDIKDPSDLTWVRRAIWSVEVSEEPFHRPGLSDTTVTGDRQTYPACQAEARRLRARGANALSSPSAALFPGAAGGWQVNRGMWAGRSRDGRSVALFGARPDAVGWRATWSGRPAANLLGSVRQFGSDPRR